MNYTTRLREIAPSSDAALAEYLSEGDLVFPRHLRDAAAFAETHDHGLILMPRGHAKTTLFTYRAARYVGLTQGRYRLGILTAVEEDANARSAAIRTLVGSTRFAEVFPWARRGVAGERWTDEHWTVRGAEAALGKDYTCRAMGLRSVRAGPRLDLLLADDMVGLQENETAGQRERVSRAYWSVVDPMVVPGGRRWFLGTRWHEEDLYAELMRKGWPHLLRRAIGDDGTALWPEVYPLEKLTDVRHDLGSAIFDLQYQNDPSGMDGNIVKRDWLVWTDTVPDGARRVGVDLAASTKERSDFTAAVECVETTDHTLYIVGAWHARLDEGHQAWLTGRGPNRQRDSDGPRLLWTTEELPPGYVGLMARDDRPRFLSAVNIEAVAHQSTFVREILSETRLPARAVHPDRDKVTRARALAARFEGGKVRLLRGAPGLGSGPTDPGDLVRELLAFPNGRHDDLVDALVYAADLSGGNNFYFTAARA